uniref:RNA binding motif-containing zinc finger protein,putative n=1 Tax=Neospora caninum (strain Liverpool) TaxID=572307 RepID=F0JB84_NEOCL|nr:RNA binding motif-containing zinc finger protein,putative [Neospora caninum Liverpool]CEL71351.1 TPA: RNA binding motif-containing zinc finger protein,putative [Neospora caninum Liverpool]
MEMPYGLPPGFEFPPGALAPAPMAANTPLMSLPPSFPQQEGHPPHFAFPGYPPLHPTGAPGLSLPVAGGPGVATPHPLVAGAGEPEAGPKQQSAHPNLGGGARQHEERENREGGSRQEGRGGRRETERERPVGPEGARNLYIHNVPRDASEDDVRQFFSKCGEVESVFLRVNQKIGPNAVYAFVLYKHPDDARKCFDTMNGAQFGGRSIRVEYQRGRRGGAGGQETQHSGGRDNESNVHNSTRNSDDHHRPSDHFPSRDGQGRNNRERERDRGGRGGGDSGRWRPNSGRGGGGDRDDSRRSPEPRGGRGGDRGAGGGGSNRDEDGRDGRYGDDHGRRGGRGRGGDRGSREGNTTQPSGTWARQPLHLTALLQERKPHLRIPSLPGNKGVGASFSGAPASSQAAPGAAPGGVRTAEPPQTAERQPASPQGVPSQVLAANAPGVSAVGSSWAWTLGRNDKRRVQVVASLVRGEVPSSLVHLTGLLNVSHRSKWEEVAAKTIHAVVTLEAAHPDQQAALDEYISYFTSKERAGVANVANQYIYLVPPNCSLFARYQGVLPARFQQASNFLLGLIGPQYSAAVPVSGLPADASPAASTAVPNLPPTPEFPGNYPGASGGVTAGSGDPPGRPSTHVPAHPQQMNLPTGAALGSFSAPQQQSAPPAAPPAGLTAAGVGATALGLGNATTANWMQQLSNMAAFLGGKK